MIAISSQLIWLLATAIGGLGAWLIIGDIQVVESWIEALSPERWLDTILGGGD